MTGTDLLIAVMERFREFGEAEDIIVVYTTAEGKQTRYKSNTNFTRSLGLVTWAKADIEHSLVGNDEAGP